MDTIYDKAGKRLKELRLQQGWTQQQLAEKASISVAFLSFIEQGRRKGSLQTYASLSKALGMDISELLRSDKAGKPVYSEPAKTFPGLSVAESQAMLKLVKKMKS
jgi:transcriptional regulator with XRE-family HTH domain